METRRLQRTGGTTFAVTLPKDWAVHHALKPGDLIGIAAESDGSLRVVNLQGRPGTKRRFHLEAGRMSEAALARRLVAAYLAGFDVIEVRGASELSVAQKETTRRLAARLVGPEIVEETDTAVVLEDLLDPQDFDLLRGLKRIHVLVRGMVHDALGAVRSRDAKVIEDVRRRDDEVDRLYWLVLKQYYLILGDPLLGVRLGLDPKRALGKLLAARLLERIGDHAELIGVRGLALDVKRVPPDLLEKTQELGGAAVRIMDGAFQALLARDAAAADHAIEETRALRDLQQLVIARATTLEGRVGVPLALLLESIDRISAYATGIAEMAINADLMGASGVATPPPAPGATNGASA